MKTLITGGAGFVGSHLCQRFLQANHQVVCLDNFCTGRRENIADLLDNPGFKLWERDVIGSFTAAERGLVAGVDMIMHLASPASPKQYQRLDLETALVNSLGTYNLLNLAQAADARFVLASTSEIYGNPQEHPQTESYWGHVNPVGPRSHYDESKRFAEMLTMLYHHRFNLDTRIARIFNTYGPGMEEEDGRAIPNFIAQTLAGQSLTIYGDGNQTRSFCYIDDLVEGLFRLATCADLAGSIVNLGNPEEIPIKEVAQRIARLCHANQGFVQHALPGDDPERRRPDISNARELLDWEPKVSLTEGLAKTIAYFKRTASTPAG